MGRKPLTSGTATVSAAKIEYQSSHTGIEEIFFFFFVSHVCTHKIVNSICGVILTYINGASC